MEKSLIIIAFILISCEDKQDQSCIDESKINPDAVCPENYDPVLGCDGEVYGNSCEAERNGVTNWTEIEGKKGLLI